jgi:hypothetical protein
LKGEELSDEMILDKMSLKVMTVDKMYLSGITVHKTSVEEIIADEMT